MCRTQILVKTNKDSEYFLKKPLGNHHIFVQGDYQDEQKQFQKIFNLKTLSSS